MSSGCPRPSIALNECRGTLALRIGESGGGDEIRPPAARALDGVFAAPGVDLGVVARKQHVRHSPAFEVCRPRVLGVFEQPTRSSRGKRFVDGTHLVAQGTRQKPHDGVGHDEGGEFSTGEHVVAKRKALIRKAEGALVDALVAAAHEEDALFMRKPLSRRLGKRRTARGEEDNMGLGASPAMARTASKMGGAFMSMP